MTGNRYIILLFAAVALQSAAAERSPFMATGTLENRRIDEASGMQSGSGGVFYVHNDEKRDVFLVDETGRDLGSFKLDGAKNSDWEDITRVPRGEGHLLVVADVGDNAAKRKDVELYFFEEPGPSGVDGDIEVAHRFSLRYPDGPRDVESVAYDPSSGSLLLLSKRDSPPRLYGITLEQALGEKEGVAEFLTEVPGFRPPDRLDLLTSPTRGAWVSQPTGMDISPDGRVAAVITYRSLYVFRREEGETWAKAFKRTPQEFVGPPGLHDEAVAFSPDGKSVYVTTERRPAPVHRLDLVRDPQ
jgi:hypothetical protein